MSYHFEGTFRTREGARRTVVKDPGLPDVIREVLLGALNALPYDTDDRFIYVKASGHQCESGGNSLERSSADLLIEPRYFTKSTPSGGA